jgi:hypothetical protein
MLTGSVRGMQATGLANVLCIMIAATATFSSERKQSSRQARRVEHTQKKERKEKTQ